MRCESKLITYRIPDGVQKFQIGRRLLLTTQQGGRIAIDRELLALWEYASGKDLSQILEHYRLSSSDLHEVLGALACLSEAGLLRRSIDPETHACECPPAHGPLISVIIVAYNSLDYLEECLTAVINQSYQPIEVILVDNGSQEDLTGWVSENFSQIQLIRLNTTKSYAAAVNLGVSHAQGDYHLILNPDVRLAPDAIFQLAAIARQHADCAAVCAKLKYWWAPAFMNGMGNRVGAFSWGTDNGLGHLDLGQFDDWEDLPSACFAAALIPRHTWRVVSHVDQGFPMYYEDVEWSYRARLFGLKVYAAPKAVGYHAFGGRAADRLPDGIAPKKLQNVVFGRLRFVLKLLDGYLLRFLFNYLLEDLFNIIIAALTLKFRTLRAYFRGYFRLGKDLPDIWKGRKTVQERRLIPDKALFAMQRELPTTRVWQGVPEMTWDIVANDYLHQIRSKNIRLFPEFAPKKSRARLLIISQDVIGHKMAGPGMRYLEMARALSDDLDVTIAMPFETSLLETDVSLVTYQDNRPDSLFRLVQQCDIVLISSFVAEKFPFLGKTNARLVIDLYDPFVLENLHIYSNESIADQDGLNAQSIAITNRLARIGDFFVCGNERQRDYWMGVLTANCRINPGNSIQDPTFRKLIDVVGIGIPNRDPHKRLYLKGSDPRFPSDSRIILWGGGIWNWLDPLTLIKAWPKILLAHPEARLVFLGTRHPNPNNPRHEMVDKAVSLANEIDEIDKSIVFFEWLNYEEREDLLTEADLGITLHPMHAETRYAMRTRVMDYFWARLPVLITEGDITSEWVQQYKVGEVVPPMDEEAVAEKIIAILDKPKDVWRESYIPLREQLNWIKVVSPLRQYCLEGTYAPDRKIRNIENNVGIKNSSMRSLVARAHFILRNEGWRTLAHRTWRYLQWRFSRSL